MSALHGIAIGIPARNEAARIERTLASVLHAARGDLPVVVVLAADACSDATELIATRRLRDAPANVEACVIRVNEQCVGAAREAACRAASHLLHPLTGGRRTWVATTDADTVVPPNWLTTHRRWARRGAHAVVGIVRVDDSDPLPDDVRALVERELASHGSHHSHVFGANLGIDTAWWRRIGGFPPVTVGEDRLVVQRLREAGARVVATTDSIVTTSGRLTPRAEGGFGSHLASLTAGI